MEEKDYFVTYTITGVVNVKAASRDEVVVKFDNLPDEVIFNKLDACTTEIHQITQ